MHSVKFSLKCGAKIRICFYILTLNHIKIKKTMGKSSFSQDFKTFAMRGNVIDRVVGGVNFTDLNLQ